MGVYIGEKTQSYAAMQWPCDSWFHVPTKDELTAIIDAWVSLWAWARSGWGAAFSTYLHLPPAAWRSQANWNPYTASQWANWQIWTCTGTSTESYCVSFTNSGSYANINTWTIWRAYWDNIRPIKDTPTIPDSWWTAVYSWVWSSGIFWSSSLWLISISSDWTTWYTIADKNLWATTAWSSWDTLSQANCGNYYQRWNNYWFPFSWSVSTTSTKVNAWTYWPWNYYSSSTFITSSSSPYNWDSSANADLWWWETWIVNAAKELQNAYIGEYRPCLCFTANTAWSTITLNKGWSPTSITLETSFDYNNWTAYTIWSTITLSNIGDRVYRRTTSTTDTTFSSSASNYYQFSMTWEIAASGDLTYLINKNWTTICPDYCFPRLFQYCSSLISAPSLPATKVGAYAYYCLFYDTHIVDAPSLPAATLWNACYSSMFGACSRLTSIPKLMATNILQYSYQAMFNWCSQVKLSTTKTWIYQNEYRIPVSWTGTVQSNALNDMFQSTGWTFTWTPSVNTTYYTSNEIV